MRAHQNRYTKTIDIVVACEQTIFILNERGTIRYQRRLEFQPSCLLTYHLPSIGADIHIADESVSKQDIMVDA